MCDVSETRTGKLGRVFGLIAVHQSYTGERCNPVPAKARPGLQSRWVGGTTQLSNESYTIQTRHRFRISPKRGVCTQCARRINQDAHHHLKIPEQISYVIRMVIPKFPITAPGEPLDLRRISPIPWRGLW